MTGKLRTSTVTRLVDMLGLNNPPRQKFAQDLLDMVGPSRTVPAMLRQHTGFKAFIIEHHSNGDMRLAAAFTTQTDARRVFRTTYRRNLAAYPFYALVEAKGHTLDQYTVEEY